MAGVIGVADLKLSGQDDAAVAIGDDEAMIQNRRGAVFDHPDHPEKLFVCRFGYTDWVVEPASSGQFYFFGLTVNRVSTALKVLLKSGLGFLLLTPPQSGY